MCVFFFSVGFIFTVRWVVFLLGSGTRIIKKKKWEKSEILDDFINISPIHSLCVAFCFFFLCFLWGLCSHIS